MSIAAIIFVVSCSVILEISSQALRLSILSNNYTNEFIASVSVGSSKQKLNLLLDFSSPYSYLLNFSSLTMRGLIVSETSSIKLDGTIQSKFPNSIFQGELASDIFEIDSKPIQLSFFLINQEPKILDTEKSRFIRIDGVLGMHDSNYDGSVIHKLFEITKSKIILFDKEDIGLESEDSNVSITIGAELNGIDTKKSCKKSQSSKWSCTIEQYKFGNNKKEKKSDNEESHEVVWKDDFIFFEALRNYDTLYPVSTTVSSGFFERLSKDLTYCRTTRDEDINSRFTIIRCDKKNLKKISPVQTCMNNTCLNINIVNLLHLNPKKGFELSVYFDRNFPYESHFNMFMLKQLNTTIAFDYSKNLIYFKGEKSSSPDSYYAEKASSSLLSLILICIATVLLIALIFYCAKSVNSQEKESCIQLDKSLILN